MVSIEPFRFSVVLTDSGPDRLRVMAGLREFRPDLSPARVKALLEGGENLILGELLRSDAQRVANTLRGLGAVVEIRNSDNEYVYENYREVRPIKPYPG